MALLLPQCRRRRLLLLVSSSSRHCYYASLSDAHIADIQSMVVNITDPTSLECYNVDFTHHHHGRSRLVVQPTNIEQVQSLLKYCHLNHLPVVPQGGNTGLVGGSVPVDDEIILSLRRLDEIHSLHDDGILHCQAGCILQNLQDYAATRGYLFPLDLGSKGTCQIGGNLATNAGGVYYRRYGSLVANTLGISVVTATGELLKLGSNQRKDNTGYKLHSLMLGSEGTLGVIVDATLQCPPLPTSIHAVWLTCPSLDAVWQVLSSAQRDLGEILAAVEWMDGETVHIVQSSLHTTLPHNRHVVLIETHGSNSAHDTDKIDTWLEKLLHNQRIVDGVYAHDETQRATFWKVRESCNPIVGRTGYTYKYDVCLSIRRIEEFLRHMRDQLPDDLQHTSWGHLMDGNVHFNVTTPGVHSMQGEVLERLDTLVYETVLQLDGSISAEHGIGVTKRKYMSQVHDPAVLALMQSVKRILDPKRILNPYKCV